MRIPFKAIVLASAVLALPGAVAAATIGFDALDASAGQPSPLASFTEGGYTFSVSSSGNNNGAAIFDTTCSGYGGGDGCNGDADLVPVVQGENGIFDNVLILQENSGGALFPNDDASGGTITLTLTGGGRFVWKGASAIDDGVFTFSTLADGQLGQVSIPGENGTGRATFKSSILKVGDSITLAYSGSGGIDSLELQAVPVPAALPFLLTGFGAFAAIRRRRKAA